jgi:hypothetical protein
MVSPLDFHWTNVLQRIAIAAVLSGCSIHPLPGDIPRVSTADVVERIRCEAQEGLRSFPSNDPQIKKIIQGTSIGYEFSFVITEDNTAPSGQLTFHRPDVAGGSFMLDVKPAATLQRMNTRAFILLEDLTTLNRASCSPEATRANWAYPITGETGMAEVIQTYIKLQMLAGLKPEAIPHITFPTVFSDALAFTTDWSAGTTATLQLNTVTGSFRLEKASITGTASRKDMHNVTVALAYDGSSMGGPTRMMLAREAGKAWPQSASILESRDLRRVARSAAEAPNRVVLELARRRRVREDFVKVDKLLGATP